MKNFAILRLEKLSHRDKKSVQSAKKKEVARVLKNEAKGKNSLIAKNSDRHIEGALNHLFREIDTPNANPNQTPQNVVLIGGDNVADIMQAIDEKTPKKVRANAVRAIEFFVGGSPKAMQAMTKDQQLAYFEKSLDFIGSKFGGRENIVSAVVHYDEKTPHLSVMLVPLVGKQLKASYFLDGKDKVRELQTEFAEEVGAKFGLERGVQKIRPRNHIETQEFYATIGQIKGYLDRNEATPEVLADLIAQIDYERTPEEIEQSIRAKRNDLLADISQEWERLLDDAFQSEKIERLILPNGKKESWNKEEIKSKLIGMFDDLLKITEPTYQAKYNEKKEVLDKENSDYSKELDNQRKIIKAQKEELEREREEISKIIEKRVNEELSEERIKLEECERDFAQKFEDLELEKQVFAYYTTKEADIIANKSEVKINERVNKLVGSVKEENESLKKEVTNLKNENKEIKSNESKLLSIWRFGTGYAKSLEEFNSLLGNYYRAVKSEKKALEDENKDLKTEVNNLQQRVGELEREPTFEELKESYYSKLNEKTEYSHKEIRRALSVLKDNKFLIREKVEAYNKVFRCLEFIKKQDENYSLSLSYKYNEEMRSARKYIDENAHLMNLRAMRM